MSYAEATAVLGSNFDISSTSSDKPDDITSDSKIERELKLLRYKDEQREFDAALTKYQSQNPDLFKDSPEKMIELIKSEVVNISTSLPVEERIRRAATVSIGNPMDRQSLAYNLLLNGAA
jgi:predicted Zn-dependent peptidase